MTGSEDFADWLVIKYSHYRSCRPTKVVQRKVLVLKAVEAVRILYTIEKEDDSDIWHKMPFIRNGAGIIQGGPCARELPSECTSDSIAASTKPRRRVTVKSAPTDGGGQGGVTNARPDLHETPFEAVTSAGSTPNPGLHERDLHETPFEEVTSAGSTPNHIGGNSVDGDLGLTASNTVEVDRSLKRFEQRVAWSYYFANRTMPRTSH